MDRGAVLAVGLRNEVESAIVRALEPDLAVRALPRVPPDGAELPGRPAAAVVSVEQDAPAALRLIARLASTGTRVVALGPVKDADVILKVMRAGADEFSLASDPEAIERAVRSQLRPTPATQQGSVVTVFAAKGGAGATSIAVNLGGVLQRRGQRVCIVDLDLNLGDVLAFLDLHGSYAIADVAANLHRLDRDLLDSSLPRHRTGLHVLAQSDKLEQADHVDGRAVGKLLELLRQHYDWVIVDGVRTLDEVPLAALDASDRVLLVLTQEIPAVRNARRCVEIFRRLGYRDGRVQLVVNRHQARSRVPDELIAETVGLPVTARIGNDFPAASLAIHQGALIADAAPTSRLVRDLEGLAPAIGAGAPQEAKERSLLKRFFSAKAVPNGA
jgi:pilus assembly protein CpaE